jgi:hypothetical protein
MVVRRSRRGPSGGDGLCLSVVVATEVEALVETVVDPCGQMLDGEYVPIGAGQVKLGARLEEGGVEFGHRIAGHQHLQ